MSDARTLVQHASLLSAIWAPSEVASQEPKFDGLDRRNVHFAPCRLIRHERKFVGLVHAELLELLQVKALTPGSECHDLYATAHRVVPAHEGLRLETWAHSLTLGDSLPTLPLWLQ